MCLRDTCKKSVSRNYFPNNTKVLFTFFIILTFTLMTAMIDKNGGA